MTDRWTPPTSIVVASDISVERTCSMVKVKIEKLEDEEKEKMSFYPKGNSNLVHYLCKHDIASLAVEQGWKLILENIDQKLVIKLLIKNETPVEKCRDKVRELIAKSLPNLHQERCDLSSLSRDLGDKDPLQQALTCLIPLVTSGQNQADVLYNKDLNCLVITGPTETVKQLYMDAKVKLYSVTMETVLESPSHGRLLRTLGVIGQLRGQYPDVTLVVQDCNTKVTWTGPEEDIRLGRQVMQTFISEIKTDTFHVSTVMKMLLLTPEIKSYINSLLQQEGIICVWQVTETGQVQVWSMKVTSSKRVGLKIRENFREEAFLVKDFPFISEASKVGFGLTAAEMNHFVVEETSDTVYVASKSNTMQKIIQHLQDLENQQTPGEQPSASQVGDNSRKRTSACTIEVRGMDKRTSNDIVELYFESRRAAGQSVDIEKFDASKRENDSVILITYETEEVAQLVLGRQHTLDGSPLTVRLFEALELCPILYQDKVFFRNLHPNTTRKALENFLRSEVKVSPTDFLYGEERGTVLVTFDGPPDFEKLAHACRKSPLDECVLEANRVPVSHSVLVSGVGKLTSQSTVEYYFENTRRSGGGNVTEVKEISDGFFLVTFEDPEVIDRVCKREHVVDGQTLTVEIYHEILGYRLSHTGPVFKVPCPLVITDADPNKIQCIMSSDTTELEKQLSDQHAKLHKPGDVAGHLKLECLLTEDVVDSHRLVLSWEEVVRDILSTFLAQEGTTKAQVAMPRNHGTSSDVAGSAQDSSVQMDTDLNKVDAIRVNDTRELFIRSSDDFEHVADISIDMPEESYMALQFFCRGELLDQQAVGYRNGMLQISCTEITDKKAIQTCIDSKLKYIEIMIKEDVSFTPAEEPKVRGTIDQIHQSVEGVFCYQLGNDEHSMVHLMAHSYQQLQTAKHKISLGLGRIRQTETQRNRKTSTQQTKGDSTPTDKDRLSRSYNESQPSWPSQSTTGYGGVSPKDFTTTEGLLVRVYPGSILHLDVDCIVSASNGDLQHGGGVAHVISNAAGYEFERESRDYIARYGPLKVGEVCTTTAGNLKYKGVIHSVGPRWYDYSQDQKWICLDNLKTAVKNSLDEADIQRYKSIAIPAISSGIFGVPKEHCAHQYYRAVEEYSRTRGSHSTLTEVHFIDKDTQMCGLIQTTFTKCFGGDLGLSSSGAVTGGRNKFSSTVRTPRTTAPFLPRSRSVSADGEGSSVDPTGLSFTDPRRNVQHSTSSGQRFEYQIGNNLTVHIVHGNIVEIKAEAIVSPENVECDSTGRIAREIARVAGQGYVEKEQSELRLPRRKPKLTEALDTLAGHSQFKYVLHVVAPKWDVASIGDQSKYWNDLQQSYNNIFSTIDKKHLPITSLALPILGTGQVAKCPCPVIDIAQLIVGLCRRYAERTLSKKTLYFCSIDITAILTLSVMFEKQLNKSNRSNEKIDGDQPLGTMTMATSKSHGSLPGYSGCGIIKITYSFPPGKQGPDHPTPGKSYQGNTRHAFLPYNAKGRLVAKLLRIAFDRKLVFTIGRSRTTGHDGVVVWNDILHKTRMDGGPQAYGYPDPNYLDEVLNDLKAKGITEESLNDP